MIGSFRFLLAIFVVISHTRGYPFDKLPDPALSAIVAFFFLSGFLMPATLDHNYDATSFTGKSIRYLINRFLRIYPVYFVALLLDFLALWHNPTARSLYYFTWPSVRQNFILLGLNQSEYWGQDQRFIGPAWTLDVELQYYILVPLLVLLARFAPKLLVALLIIASCVGLHHLIEPTGQDSIDRSLLTWSPFFILGFISYWYRKTLLNRVSLNALFCAGTILCAISLGLGFLSRSASHWVFAFALLAFAARLLLSAKKQSKADRMFGDLAYPVFIMHAVVNTSGLPGELANLIAPGSVAVLTLSTLALTLPLCIAVDLLISRPIDRLRQRLRRSSPGRKPLEHLDVPASVEHPCAVSP
jgi:peptidoglycan/LPS O-acetylase OafA/YrhL